MLDNGLIRKLDSPILGGWVSNIFLIAKKSSGFHLICNLKFLNNFVAYKKFKLEDIHKVIDLLRLCDCQCSLDVTQSYGNLYLKESYQKYFHFSWRGQHYCYITLVQGFSDTPRIFTRCTSPILAVLQKALIDIVMYIDDTFLRARTPEELVQNVNYTRNIFENCGFTINTENLV